MSIQNFNPKYFLIISFLSLTVAPCEKNAVFAETKTSNRSTYGIEDRKDDNAVGSE